MRRRVRGLPETLNLTRDGDGKLFEGLQACRRSKGTRKAPTTQCEDGPTQQPSPRLDPAYHRHATNSLRRSNGIRKADTTYQGTARKVQLSSPRLPIDLRQAPRDSPNSSCPASTMQPTFIQKCFYKAHVSMSPNPNNAPFESDAKV